ncbi:hypothetical protein HAX54_010281, partial [Datura stramonium]|nr:hypothetical protein [Datura stramonium]
MLYGSPRNLDLPFLCMKTEVKEREDVQFPGLFCLMDHTPGCSDKVTLKKWFFIDKR